MDRSLPACGHDHDEQCGLCRLRAAVERYNLELELRRVGVGRSHEVPHVEGTLGQFAAVPELRDFMFRLPLELIGDILQGDGAAGLGAPPYTSPILQATRVHQCGPCAAGSQSGKWRAISDASIDAHVETDDHEAAVADAADDADDEGDDDDDDDDDRFIRYLLATASFAICLSYLCFTPRLR